MYAAEISELSKVLKELKPYTDWKRLGLILGLYYPTLDTIERNNDTMQSCMMEMLAAWLKKKDGVLKEGGPTWLQLKQALRTLEENALVDSIARRHH